MEKITKQIWDKNDLPENLLEMLMDKYNEVKQTTKQPPDASAKAQLSSQLQIQSEQNLPLKEIIENITASNSTNTNQRNNIFTFEINYF